MSIEKLDNCSTSNTSIKYMVFEEANQLTYLVDKVCRLREKDMSFKDDELTSPPLRATKTKYEEVIKYISNFMALPNDNSNF